MHRIQALEVPEARAELLLLRVRHGQRNWLFEFRRGDQRAVIVGSLPTVDIRVSSPAVAPVHFHFERERDAIWLIPGYQAPVMVNHTAVLGACLMPLFAVVDLSSERLEVEVYDEALTAPTSTEQETARQAASKLDAPPGHPLAETVRTGGVVPDRRSFIPDPSLLDTIAWQRPALLPALVPVPKPPPTAPIEITAPRVARHRHSWLARLGLLTQRRPLLVATVTALAALILAFALRELVRARLSRGWSPCLESAPRAGH